MKKIFTFICTLLLTLPVLADADTAFERAISKAEYEVLDDYSVVYTIYLEPGHTLVLNEPYCYDPVSYMSEGEIVYTNDQITITFYDGSDPYGDDTEIYIYFTSALFDGYALTDYVSATCSEKQDEPTPPTPPTPQPTYNIDSLFHDAIRSATYTIDENDYIIYYTLVIDQAKNGHTYGFLNGDTDVADALSNMSGELQYDAAADDKTITIAMDLWFEPERQDETIDVTFGLYTFDGNPYNRYVTVTFYPLSQGPSGIETIEHIASAHKFMRNGQVLIEQGGKVFSLQGKIIQ